MNQQLDRKTLNQILQAKDIQALSFPALLELFRQEKGLADFLPDGICQIDPRNGDRILFNSSRARRPHDNRPADSNAPKKQEACVVCQGKTTGVIDVADLSEGFTFINKNLFPALYPLQAHASHHLADGVKPDSGVKPQRSHGLHLLQWTSSLHDKDWHNMPLEDRVVVMQRLAALERKLLTDGKTSFVSIIKNYGRLVGGSLVHGHQQIALSNVMPRRIHDNWRFEKERGEKFSTYMLRENPAKLLIRDYGAAVLLTPYFMRRPYDMMLLVKDTGKQHIHELTEPEIEAVAKGWRDALRAILSIMPGIGRETAYNVVTHNGPGAGLYFEFLPYVQETGGFEHLGLFVCQGNPKSAAVQINEFLEHPL